MTLEAAERRIAAEIGLSDDPCEICGHGDNVEDLDLFRDVWAHRSCLPTHWVNGTRGRSRKWAHGWNAPGRAAR